MKSFSNIVYPEANVFFLIVAMICAKNKLKVFNFFSYACIMVFMNMCLKSIFMEPRPYMVNWNITPMEKYAEYGNPSGHVFMGYIVVSWLLERLMYCHDLWVEHYEYDQNGKKTKICEVCENLNCNQSTRAKIYLIHFIFIMGIFVSRIYLGMHSLDQGLFSLFNGVYFHFLYNVYFAYKLERIIRRILIKKGERMQLFYLIVLNVLTVILTFMLYSYNS